MTPCEEWLTTLGDGTTRWGIFSAVRDPFVAETLAEVGYDWVLVDLQHGMADPADLAGLLQAIEAGGAAAVVRVAAHDPALIGRALDLGAWAVVVPMIDSAEQAAEAVAAARYAPEGTRSFGPIRGRAPISEQPRILAMVETATALRSVDEICAVPGLLGVFVGPSDLAISLGVDVDYEVGSGVHHEALATVAAAAKRAGVVAAVQTAGADEARLRVEQGYHLVSMRSDWLVLREAAQRMLAAAAAI